MSSLALIVPCALGQKAVLVCMSVLDRDSTHKLLELQFAMSPSCSATCLQCGLE